MLTIPPQMCPVVGAEVTSKGPTFFISWVTSVTEPRTALGIVGLQWKYRRGPCPQGPGGT